VLVVVAFEQVHVSHDDGEMVMQARERRTSFSSTSIIRTGYTGRSRRRSAQRRSSSARLSRSRATMLLKPRSGSRLRRRRDRQTDVEIALGPFAAACVSRRGAATIRQAQQIRQRADDGEQQG